MRLFTGLDLSGDVEAQLDRLLGELRPTASLQWSPLSNLHITTKFIGDWPAQRLPELIEALGKVPKPGLLDIAVRGVGWFPNPHHPQVLFAGVTGPAALHELAGETDETCKAIGIPGETRPYVPHLTLARIRTQQSLNAVRLAIAQRESLDFGAFTASSFYLYASEPGPLGSTYKKLSEFALA